MIDKERYYPNIHAHGYTYSRFENLTYVPHVHPAMECVVLLKGGIQVSIDQQRYLLKAGDIALIMPQKRHSFLTRQQSDAFAFGLVPEPGGVLSEYAAGRYDLPSPIFRNGDYPETVRTLLALLLDDATRTSSWIAQKSLLAAMVGYLFEVRPPVALPEGAPIGLEDRVMMCLNREFQTPITLNQAAEELGISPFRLSRLCNQVLGMGFNAYLRSMRIAAAKRRLAFTDMGMEAIAQDVGFESLRTFNRAFSEETGGTPRAFRSMHKNRTSLNFSAGKAAGTEKPVRNG